MQMFDALACEYSSRTDRNAMTKIAEEIEKLESEFIDAQNRDQEYLDNRLDDISSSNSNISTQHLEGDQGKKLRNAAETKLKEQQNRLKCLCNEIFKLEIITSK